MLTIHAAIEQALSDGRIDTYAQEYAEPGYTKDSDRDILFANWNATTHYDRDKKEFVTDDDTMPRLQKLAERAGYTTEWSDEWTTCGDCSRAVRTSADSYGWMRSYAEIDGDILCRLCIADAPEEYLESLEGYHERAETIGIDPEAYGYHKVNAESYEHGWHPGQHDSPAVVARSLRDRDISRFLFKIDDVGQFDVKFSVYVHDEELPLLAAEPVKSELPYDPGTEMGKALRGEHSDHYTVETRQITPEEFVSGEWAKKEKA